jgi:hypothetical protein
MATAEAKNWFTTAANVNVLPCGSTFVPPHSVVMCAASWMSRFG